MVRNAGPKVVVDERVEMGAYLVGILGALAAAYHTAQTGNPFPLFGACSVLVVSMLLVTSEE